MLSKELSQYQRVKQKDYNSRQDSISERWINQLQHILVPQAVKRAKSENRKQKTNTPDRTVYQKAVLTNFSTYWSHMPSKKQSLYKCTIRLKLPTGLYIQRASYHVNISLSVHTDPTCSRKSSQYKVKTTRTGQYNKYCIFFFFFLNIYQMKQIQVQSSRERSHHKDTTLWQW